MKFGFMTIVLNGGDYLEFSLQNTYNLAAMYPGSEIVLVEGADSFSNSIASTERGLSVDGTEGIIKSFPDPLGIIKYIPLGRVEDKRKLRQAGLDALHATDYIIIRDHDEFIKSEDFTRMANLAEIQDCINLTHYMFRGSFNLRYSTDYSRYTLRGYRNAPGLAYSNWHIFPSLKGVEIGKYSGSGPKSSSIPFYHFGYVTTGFRLFNKRVFTVRQLNWYYTEKAPKPAREPLEMPVWGNYANNPDTLPMDHLLWVQNKELPLELIGHPWWNKKIEEIWNWSESFTDIKPVLKE